MRHQSPILGPPWIWAGMLRHHARFLGGFPSAGLYERDAGAGSIPPSRARRVSSPPPRSLPGSCQLRCCSVIDEIIQARMTGREKHEHVVLFLYISEKNLPGSSNGGGREGSRGEALGREGELCLPGWVRGPGGSRGSSPHPATISADGGRGTMSGRDTRGARPGASVVPDPAASPPRTLPATPQTCRFHHSLTSQLISCPLAGLGL